MRTARLVTAFALVLLVAAPAARAATVSGKVKGAKGYTLLAIGSDGRAASKKLGGSGAFKLHAKRGTTLQLIRPTGVYYGPVVLARKGYRGQTALSGKGAKLGVIKLKGGWAQPRKPAPRKALDPRTKIRVSKQGKPLGAGRLGLVSTKAKARFAALGGPGGGGGDEGPGADPDQDGVPSAADADDNGNMVLDGNDSSQGGSGAGLFTDLRVLLQNSINVNAGGVTPARLDAAVRDHLNLIFYMDDKITRAGRVTSADVDCFQLAYCRAGSGSAVITGLSESPADLPRDARWVTYDRNGNGLPDLDALTGRGAHGMGVFPRVTRAQIAPGDSFNVLFGTDRGQVTLPTVLTQYFATTPALVSFDGGSGPQPVTYPVPDGATLTDQAPAQLTSERLTVTFWRPQRPAIGVESGDYMDVGHLHYGFPLEANGQEIGCREDYSSPSPELRMSASSQDFAEQLWPLTDQADDERPDASRTLSFTIDLGACLRRNGVDPAGRTLRLTLTAAGESRPGGSDRAGQMLSVRLPG